MLNNLVIGKYIPFDSIIHKLHPLVKIIDLFIILIGIFLVNSLYVYGFVFAFILSIVFISKVPISIILKQLKVVMFMLVFIGVLNLFIIRQGNIVFSFASFKVYDKALLQTGFIFARLTSMIFISSILTLSTKPMDLTYGIEAFLAPLKKVKFPSHEVAMMISIALRFIPTLIEETNKIMIAQTSRGVDFQSRSLKEKISAIISLLIPLFVSSFKRAEELANAMEARGYDPSAKRTRYVNFKWRNTDTISLLISVLFTGAIICYTIIV